ncbi:nitroreductase family protein [Aliarcobacter butzleri]|uniref:Nitroreductase family protein n=1 Tax=Aliarcobacter butzleri TaxID=28197 RepID=A0AAP4P560_9BACT|nr:nitroreductase family protein [Aliarcobacter butzleri]MCG3671470.1 nitroreductase family protein [Aliarcobacter butzleri]MCG3679968.1 nitroreductase family protein [Aliarcobacter butzleri]MCG3690610.1 nitroreductase family protein [Aliarcobacter butzleri]MDK2040813.1 nitroreductase family protein [Aliarcobacter butzleri]MDK2095651.1 nitroreductase family protein [Aliarcobacter butzleri]
MNPIIKQLSERKSIRQFTGEFVKDEDLELIIKTAQRCPTSINGQQISLIYTRDKEKIKQIAQLCGGQEQIATADVFITICVDFNRTIFAVEQTGEKHQIDKSAEGVLVGAVDAGIMLNAIQITAESLGYGTTAIGAVRNEPAKMIELLNLPLKTFPIVGTTIGVPTLEAKNAPLKPRIPLESFAFEDNYDDKKVKDGVLVYEKQMKKFREDNNMNYLQSYCEQTANYYKNIYFRKIEENYTKQGFIFKD